MGTVNKNGVWHPDFPGDVVSVGTGRVKEHPITICAHCLRPLLKHEVKGTFEGTITIWDERAKRCNVTLDFCADGMAIIEKSLTTGVRESVERDAELKRIDAEDKAFMHPGV